MPIREISAESVRDNSIRQGSIRSLHLWWARRPLPVCRAAVFASLVPDPADAACPKAFCDAVEQLLGAEANPDDPYRPYENIPYTKIGDPMDDNLRNRLLMFIGKFSEVFTENEKSGKPTPAKSQLSSSSLIKWDNKNDDEIIGKARKLIWVAHNARNGSTAKDLIDEFDKAYKGIRDAERDLYSTLDRHIESDDVQQKESNLSAAIEAFLDRMPRVFDPFAGGGAIPLEAARLGCRSFGNDINPVAHIIQKASLEFPQKFGKPIVYTTEEFISRYGENTYKGLIVENPLFKEKGKVKIQNRLAFDIEFYAKETLKRAESQIGHLYPTSIDGTRPVAYYWVRTVRCSNPSCKAEVPLLKNFGLSSKAGKEVFLKPKIEGTEIKFSIGKGKHKGDGYVHSRKNLRCPVCGNQTTNAELKERFLAGNVGTRLLAVVEDGRGGKTYRLPTKEEENPPPPPDNKKVFPMETLPVEYTKAFDLCIWGFVKHGHLYSDRQLAVMNVLATEVNRTVKELVGHPESYRNALAVYLSVLLNRIAARMTTFGIYNTTAETIEHPFGRQAIAMVFDYPEVNPFSKSGGGGLSQIDWIKKYILTESHNPFSTVLHNASSGEKEQFAAKSISAVVTDPPYYNAIGYADLSDFFYVWLKRTLGETYPANFGTPQTPKTDECTALKHYHDGSETKANEHFERKLLQIFDAIEHQTSDVVSIMFAHQSTEAWTTLCNSILGAGLNITGSWAIDTERSSAGMKTMKASLSSSVTVSCTPISASGSGDYKSVKQAIEAKVEDEVNELYGLGFRGADLLTACFGKAVGEFGKYERVEKASGDEVTVAELLEMTRESAFNALLKGFEGDEYTKFYIGWLELQGFQETDHNEAVNFVRVGLSINVDDLVHANIFVVNGNKKSLADYRYRNEHKRNLGENVNAPLIDQVHRAMSLYKGGNRKGLLHYIGERAASPDSSFWRVLTSLQELLQKDTDDEKQVAGLLENKDNLIRESKTPDTATADQQGLKFE